MDVVRYALYVTQCLSKSPRLNKICIVNTQRGCVEIFASAKNTAARLREVYESKGVPATDIDAREVFERAAAGDVDAQTVLTTVSRVSLEIKLFFDFSHLVVIYY